MSEVCIRLATIEDAEVIYNIYEPYILNTVITFEYDKVPIENFRDRMRMVTDKFPWLVYQVDGEVVGYAYCSLHRERVAYGWDCECSVYLKEGFYGRGIGTSLYKALFMIMEELGYYNVYSLICIPNENSVALHKKFGFEEVGIYYNTAYKHGSWRDLLVMEKRLKKADGKPEPVLRIGELRSESLNHILKKAMQ